ncbi:MAG: Uma2 family endonuclease [Bacteroidota bacterium]
MNSVKVKFPKGFTDESFYRFCRLNEDLQMEREADGRILIKSLTSSQLSSFNAEINTEVNIWNREEKPGKVFDSNGGFTLPDTSVRGPDTAWIAIERWKALPKEDRKRFAHISPDFVIEIRSETDNLEILQEKMSDYIKNGVRLAWLIDPHNQQTFIYRINGTIELVDSFEKVLSGEDVLEGFELKLSDLWEEED